MTYRHDAAPERHWKAWRDQHRESLANAGVPYFVLSDELRWLRFIGDGYDYETGWSVQQMTANERARLRTLLQSEYGDSTARSCLGPR